MNYEIVTLEEMHIIGLATRTSNAAPDMGAKIGGLWQRLYGEGLIGNIPARTNANTYGLYTNYASDVNGEYDVLAGCATAPCTEAPAGFTTCTIPAGRYARFSLTVDMTKEGVGATWAEIWATPLPRAYTVDLEEYLPNDDMTKAPVNIYIALAE